MNNPCTSCKHYQPSYRCGLTGLLTSCSRAYKTDEDDCFEYKSQWDRSVVNMTKQERDIYNKMINKDGE